MYKIGEFSKITGITVKALRYYDKENIICPANRDESSYRFYNEDSYKRALMVKQLRTYDFSISEIKDVIKMCVSDYDFNYVLSEKISLIEAEINEKRKLVDKIKDAKKLKSEEKVMHDNRVIIKDIPSMKVASMKYQGRYEECGNYISQMTKKLGGKIAGSFMNLYYDLDYNENANVEVCVPIKKEYNDKDIQCRQVGAIKAVTYIHQGGYDTISQAYKKIFDFVKENDIEIGLPSREVYHKGPGMIFKGNPNRYVTEIIYPIIEND
jgi:DNA-binding transcriptional MerR regulator